MFIFFFFQAEDGIRDAQESRGLGDVYKRQIPYTPRIYLTEDDCYDITITTIINYDFYEVAPVETVDYLTAYCPELLDKLTPAIYLSLIHI